MLTGGSVFGEFKLLSPLGRGPKASVWVASRVYREERVALKILDPGKLPADKQKRKLEALVRATTRAGRLEHANLPGVYGTVVREEDGLFGIATEYFDGGPFENMGHIGDPLVLDRVLHLMTQLGTLLSWLHKHDLVHGNVKPTNVLVTPGAYGPTVKLLDLCWSLAGLGSPNARAFVSPEANVREPITALTDQWAMAKLLHQLVVKGSGADTSASQALTTLPLPVLRVMKRALENSPRARFNSMAAFVQAIEHAREEVLEGEEQPVAAREPTVPIAFDDRTAPHVAVGRGAVPTEPGMPPVRIADDSGDFEPVEAPTESTSAVRREVETEDIRPERATVDLGIDPTPSDLGAIDPSADAFLARGPVRPQDPTDRYAAVPPKRGGFGYALALLVVAAVIVGAGWVLFSNPAFLETRAPTTTAPDAAAAPAPVAEVVRDAGIEVERDAGAPVVEAPPVPAKPTVGPEIVKLQRACERGAANACVSLGEHFEDGIGVKKSARAATIWFERACGLRSTSGCLKAAATTTDSSDARRLYEKACDARNAAACHQLAAMWRRGVGGRQSDRTAEAFERRACEFGLRSACE